MVISVKIVKIEQLKMSVESQESKMHSGFFRLKKITIGELNMEGFCRGYPLKKFLSDHSETVTKFAVAGLILTWKFISSLKSYREINII
jgi:hypothetical protein